MATVSLQFEGVENAGLLAMLGLAIALALLAYGLWQLAGRGRRRVGSAGIAAGVLAAAGVLLAVVVVWHRRRLRLAPRTRTGQAAGADEPAEALDQVARRIESRVDAKIAELRRLLADADARIAQLHHLAPPQSGQTDSATPHGTDLSRRQEEILRLHSQGMDAVRIARRMEMDVGEVDLVLNLHRQQTRASGRGQH